MGSVTRRSITLRGFSENSSDSLINRARAPHFVKASADKSSSCSRNYSGPKRMSSLVSIATMRTKHFFAGLHAIQRAKSFGHRSIQAGCAFDGRAGASSKNLAHWRPCHSRNFPTHSSTSTTTIRTNLWLRTSARAHRTLRRVAPPW